MLRTMIAALVLVSITPILAHSKGTVQETSTQANHAIDPQGLQRGLAAYQTGNFEDAVNWYRKAAEQGNVSAQNGLGVMYGTGLCVRAFLV